MSTLICSGCGHLSLCVTDSSGVVRCRACGAAAPVAGAEGTEAPAGIPVPENVPDALSPLYRNLVFGLSLPERFVRSGVGLAAGAAQELAALAVPQAFQSSKSYEIAITSALSFLTETIGGVERGDRPATDEGGDLMARKAVGNFVDLAGLALFHASPMWVLAVVSDVCYGTRTYVEEVAKELQAQGVIDDASTIHNVDDILTAVQSAAGSAASVFDRPPLSIDELRKTVEETRQTLSSADVRKLLPEAELRRYWQEMRQTATQENVSLLGVSTAVTMRTLDQVKTVSQGTLTGIRVAGGLLNRNVLTHYVDSLHRVREKGFYESVRESSTPYVEAVWRNFSTERKTWTETILDPSTLTGAIGKVFRFLTPGGGTEQPAAG